MSKLTDVVDLALEGRPAAPLLVQALWAEQPDVEAWLADARTLVRERGGDIFDGGRKVLDWVRDAVRAGFPADHDAVTACEIVHIDHVARDDGGFAEAKALYARVPRPEVAALVVKGAFTMRDYMAAVEFAKLAGDQRALAGALLELRQWGDAFAILDEALAERGPLFGGGGVTVWRKTTDPREAAIDDAVTIASWTSEDVPEWVRAVGGMWEAFADEPAAAMLEGRFLAGLHALGSLDDFEVVIRQACERDHVRAAERAVQVGCERFPELAEGEQQEQLELYIVRALRKRDPAAARARGLALVQDLGRDPQRLAESELGIATVDTMLDLLIAAKDRQALAVQQTLVDAKLALWGDCPSVWLERHNLGTVHAQLGEPDVARTLIEAARARLAAQFGEQHPHVQMCNRSLARIASA